MARNFVKPYRADATGKAPVPANMQVGEIASNPIDGKLWMKKSDNTLLLIGSPLSKSLSIDSPTAADNVILFFTPVALTLASLQSLVKGASPSVTFSLRYGTDVSLAGTAVVTAGVTCTNTTTGQATTTFNNATIPAGSWVWLTTSAITGTPTLLHVSALFGA